MIITGEDKKPGGPELAGGTQKRQFPYLFKTACQAACKLD